jgi:phage protein D
MPLDVLDTAALYGARPAFALDGEAAPLLADSLAALVVVETTDGLYRCEATFGNWGAGDGSVGFLHFDRATFDFGRALSVTGGTGEAAGTLFDGHITGLEAHFPGDRPPELTVLAEDRLQDLRMTRRTRAFADVSDADLARQIASDHSLRADVDAEGPTYRSVAQLNLSDLAFLRARGRLIGAQVWAEGGTLHFQQRARRDAGTLTLTLGQRLNRFSALADLAQQRTAVAVSGWDVAAKAAVRHEAGARAIASEAEGETGPELLESAFGARVERVVHQGAATQEQTRAFAEAELRQTARRFVTGMGTAEGDARLRVGARVELGSIGPLFSGAHFVTQVRHTFDSDGGFRSHFRTERAWIGA